jgi:hypothetical protein
MSGAPSFIDRFAQLRTRIRDRLRKVNDTTERAVLGAGNHLQDVVTIARTHIEQLRGLLAGPIGANDSELARAIASQADHVREHGATLGAAVVEHASKVASVAEQARQITEAAAQIERTNTAARALSINVRIEAARSGLNVFKTIATEMQALSRSIGDANRRIRELAISMETTLPALVAQSQSLSTMVSDYAVNARARIDHIDHEILGLRTSVDAALKSSDGALASIITASQDGLSNLQFQDVCAQSLLQIDTWQAETIRELATELDVDADLEPTITTISKDDLGLDHPTGDVILF